MQYTIRNAAQRVIAKRPTIEAARVKLAELFDEQPHGSFYIQYPAQAIAMRNLGARFAKSEGGRVITMFGSYARYAWTGGESPREDVLDIPQVRALYDRYLTEQLTEWRAYWGDRPDPDTLSIFRGRALGDAYETARRASVTYNAGVRRG